MTVTDRVEFGNIWRDEAGRFAEKGYNFVRAGGGDLTAFETFMDDLPPAVEAAYQASIGEDHGYQMVRDVIEEELLAAGFDDHIIGEDQHGEYALGDLIYETIKKRELADHNADQLLDDVVFNSSWEKDEYEEALIESATDVLAHSEVSIRIDEGALKQVVADGEFKTQFETNTSRGTLDHDVRRKAEAVQFGLDPAATEAEERPVYGYMDVDRANFNSEEKAAMGGTAEEYGRQIALTQYGTVRVILKDSVRDRTTFTAGDSLAMQSRPSPINDPQLDSFAGNWNLPKDLGMSGTNAFTETVRYVEAQVHGGVTIGDISHVVFETPPTSTDWLDDADISHSVVGAYDPYDYGLAIVASAGTNVLYTRGDGAEILDAGVDEDDRPLGQVRVGERVWEPQLLVTILVHGYWTPVDVAADSTDLTMKGFVAFNNTWRDELGRFAEKGYQATSGAGVRWTVDEHGRTEWYNDAHDEWTSAPYAAKHFGPIEVALNMTEDERGVIVQELSQRTMEDILGPWDPDAAILDIIQGRVDTGTGDPTELVNKSRMAIKDLIENVGMSTDPDTFENAVRQLELGTMMQIDSMYDYVKSAQLNREAPGELLADYVHGRITQAELSQALTDGWQVPVEAAAVSFFNRGWQQSSASFRSQVMQDAAAKVFDLPGQSELSYRQYVEEDRYRFPQAQENFMNAQGLVGYTARSVVAASSRVTSTMIADRDAYFKLLRGTSNPNIRYGSDMVMNPMSSWTIDTMVAENFGRNGAVIQTMFHRDSVIGWHGIGLGSQNEAEFVVAGEIVGGEFWDNVAQFAEANAVEPEPVYIDADEYGGPDWIHGVADTADLSIQFTIEHFANPWRDERGRFAPKGTGSAGSWSLAERPTLSITHTKAKTGWFSAPVHEYRADGHDHVIRSKIELTDEQTTAMLGGVVLAHNEIGGNPVEVDVKSAYELADGGYDNVHAFVTFDNPDRVTVVYETLLDRPPEAVSDQFNSASDEYGVSRYESHPVTYVMLHEMGHVAQVRAAQSDPDTVNSSLVATFEQWSSSAPGYAASNPAELHAEAFAEYVNTGGSNDADWVAGALDGLDVGMELAVAGTEGGVLGIVEFRDGPDGATYVMAADNRTDLTIGRSIQFNNIWRDEKGRFAPKGYAMSGMKDSRPAPMDYKQIDDEGLPRFIHMRDVDGNVVIVEHTRYGHDNTYLAAIKIAGAVNSAAQLTDEEILAIREELDVEKWSEHRSAVPGNVPQAWTVHLPDGGTVAEQLQLAMLYKAKDLLGLDPAEITATLAAEGWEGIAPLLQNVGISAEVAAIWTAGAGWAESPEAPWAAAVALKVGGWDGTGRWQEISNGLDAFYGAELFQQFPATIAGVAAGVERQSHAYLEDWAAQETDSWSGFDGIEAWRGVTNYGGWRDGDSISVHGYPLSSWSTQKYMAEQFADFVSDNDPASGTVVLETFVDVGDFADTLFSFSGATGFGASREMEVILKSSGGFVDADVEMMSLPSDGDYAVGEPERPQSNIDVDGDPNWLRVVGKLIDEGKIIPDDTADLTMTGFVALTSDRATGGPAEVPDTDPATEAAETAFWIARVAAIIAGTEPAAPSTIHALAATGTLELANTWRDEIGRFARKGYQASPIIDLSRVIRHGGENVAITEDGAGGYVAVFTRRFADDSEWPITVTRDADGNIVSATIAFDDDTLIDAEDDPEMDAIYADRLAAIVHDLTGDNIEVSAPDFNQFEAIEPSMSKAVSEYGLLYEEVGGFEIDGENFYIEVYNDYGKSGVKGGIVTLDGSLIGNFERLFHIADGELYNRSFRIDPDYQGRGIGTAFLDLTEGAIRDRFGLERVGVEAVDVGRVAWASRGFGFDFYGDNHLGRPGASIAEDWVNEIADRADTGGSPSWAEDANMVLNSWREQGRVYPGDLLGVGVDPINGGSVGREVLSYGSGYLANREIDEYSRWERDSIARPDPIVPKLDGEVAGQGELPFVADTTDLTMTGFALTGIVEFVNPWRDELGRFAPKGYGTMRAVSKLADGLYSVGTASGETIMMDGPGVEKLSTEDRDEIMNAAADMYDLVPTKGGPVSITIVDGDWLENNDYHIRKNKVGWAVGVRNTDSLGGFVKRSDPKIIHLNADAINREEPPKRKGMPFSEKVPRVRALVYHEYGHSHLWSDPDGKIPVAGKWLSTQKNMLMPTARHTFNFKSMTPYGKSKATESHAEAFAEFFGTVGTTKNRAAKYWAKEYGWQTLIDSHGVEDADVVAATSLAVVANDEGPDPEPATGDELPDGFDDSEDDTSVVVEVDEDEGPVLFDDETADFTMAGFALTGIEQFSNPWRDENGRFAPKGYTATGKNGALVADAATLAKVREQAVAQMKAVPKPSVDDVVNHQVDTLLAAEKLVRAGGERRGNSTARAKRLLNLADKYGSGRDPAEDAVMPCPFTGVLLAATPEAAAKHNIDMASADKLLVGPDGGGYKLSNVVPVAPPANQSRGDTYPDWLGKPDWGDPSAYAAEVVAANKPAIAAEYHRRRTKTLATRERSFEKHLEMYPNALPEDWDGEDFTPAGPAGSVVEAASDLHGFGINSKPADVGRGAVDAVHVDRGEFAGDRFDGHEVVVGFGFGVTDRVDPGRLDERTIVSETLGSHDSSIGEIHGGIVELANPWRDEIGRFAPKGYSARKGISARILNTLDNSGDRIKLDGMGIGKAAPEVAKIGWAVRSNDELWDTEAVPTVLAWDDLQIGLEDSVKTKHVAKVVTGQEPLREGYPVRVMQGPDGDYVIADGHTRAVMHSLMETAEIETIVLPWEKAQAAATPEWIAAGEAEHEAKIAKLSLTIEQFANPWRDEKGRFAEKGYTAAAGFVGVVGFSDQWAADRVDDEIARVKEALAGGRQDYYTDLYKRMGDDAPEWQEPYWVRMNPELETVRQIDKTGTVDDAIRQELVEKVLTDAGAYEHAGDVPFTDDAIAKLDEAVALFADNPAIAMAAAAIGTRDIVYLNDKDAGIAARYASSLRTIVMSDLTTGAGLSSPKPLTSDAWQPDAPHVVDVLRHEFGHAVHFALMGRSSTTKMTQEFEKNWSDWSDGGYDLMNGRGQEFLDRWENKRGLSSYAAQNVKEGFAETFSFVSHPTFDRDTVTDPKLGAMVDNVLDMLDVAAAEGPV